MPSELPFLKIYPGDVLRAVGLCSNGARGVYFSIQLLAHDCDRPGYLIRNGVPLTDASIAQFCGLDLPLYTTLLDELFRFSALNRNEQGTVFCPLMVAQWKRRKECQNLGKKGGNPTLNQTLNPTLKGEVNSPVKPRVKHAGNMTSEYESDFSLFSPEEGNGGKPRWKVLSKWKSPEYEKAFKDWIECRMSHKSRLADPDVTFGHQAEFLSGLSEQDAILSLKNSTMNGWQGLFPPNRSNSGQNGKPKGMNAHESSEIDAWGNKREDFNVL